MRFHKYLVLSWVVLGFMTGCGGSDSTGGAVSDPFSTNQQSSTTNATPTGSGTVLNYGMSLSTVGSSGTTTVGSNGTVITTATLKDSNNKPVAGQTIKFEEMSTDGTSAVSIPTPLVETSSEGTATTFLKTAETTVNKDVIIKASTSINGQVISAVSVFKVVRSAGNYVNFVTSKDPTDPDGNLNRLNVSVKAVDPVAHHNFSLLQLVTFEVLDKDGIRRTGVPVQLEIYYVMGNCTSDDVSIGSPESAPRTVTTDNTGLGVFSASVTLPTPAIGSESSCSVIYKATTQDPYSTGLLFSYGGYVSTLQNERP